MFMVWFWICCCCPLGVVQGDLGWLITGAVALLLLLLKLNQLILLMGLQFALGLLLLKGLDLPSRQSRAHAVSPGQALALDVFVIDGYHVGDADQALSRSTDSGILAAKPDSLVDTLALEEEVEDVVAGLEAEANHLGVKFVGMREATCNEIK